MAGKVALLRAVGVANPDDVSKIIGVGRLKRTESIGDQANDNKVQSSKLSLAVGSKMMR